MRPQGIASLMLALLPATPELMTFVDDLEDLGPTGSVVTERTIADVLVSISTADGSMVAGTYDIPEPSYFGGANNVPNVPLNPRNVSGSRFMRVLDGTPLPPTVTFDFSTPVCHFGLTTIDLLEDQGASTDWVTLRAFDSSGALVDEMTRTGDQGPSGLDLDWLVSSGRGDIVQAQMLFEIAIYAGHGFDDLALCTESVDSQRFCDATDNSLASCPCVNPGSAGTGCDLAQGTGGVALTFVAQQTSPLNRATAQGIGFPAMATPTAIVIRGSHLDPSSPMVFGDGLRCVGVPLVRLGANFAFGGDSVHIFGHGTAAGSGTFFYQLWFRSTPASWCTPDAFNLSNGRTLVW